MKLFILIPLLLAISVWTLSGCHRPVQTHLIRKDIIETVYASGKIVSDSEYNIISLNNGRILQKKVRDGDPVRSGQVLFIVENEATAAKYEAAVKNWQNTALNVSERSPLLKDLRLNLEKAGLRVHNDSLNYFRWKSLWDEGIGTRSNLDNAFTNYQISMNDRRSALERLQSTVEDLRVSNSGARSQVVATKKELSDYYIRSDRDGIVWQTYKEAGEGMRANEVVAVVGDGNKRIIRLAVDQEDISRVAEGQKVLLKTDMSGSKIFQARVRHVYPAMNEIDQTFRVDAEFLDSMPPAYVHGSVEANIIVASKSGATVLMREALVEGDSVWILEKGKQRKVGVSTGLSTLDYVEIVRGIDERTTVILLSKNGEK